MPELREARQQLVRAQREALVQAKAVHAAALALGLARSAKGATDRSSSRSLAGQRTGSAKAATLKAALTKATRLLKSARNFEMQASRKLAKVIASEAAKVSAETKARTLALYQEKQELKAEADLQKALAGFTAAWKKRRARIDARKLVNVKRKASAQATRARKKADAKARAAVEKAAALAKAGARRVADKARAKAARLQVRV